MNFGYELFDTFNNEIVINIKSKPFNNHVTIVRFEVMLCVHIVL